MKNPIANLRHLLYCSQAANLNMSADGPYNDTFVLLISEHITVGIVTNGKNMRRKIPDAASPVGLDLFGGVNRQYLVGVHRNKD